MSTQLWEVVGGGDKGGILVRESESLKSPEHTIRLATGALVRERELVGERLHFEKLSGGGPSSGWVSLRLKGKELVIPKEESTIAAVAPASSEFSTSIHSEYYVLQSNLIKRLGSDPATPDKTIKISRKVGSKVFSTGRTWTGPQGGEWIELDGKVEKPGWLLVEGRGFGAPGPLLRMVQPDAETPIVLHVLKPERLRDPDNVEVREFLIEPSAKIRDAKQWVALMFDLDASKIIVGAPETISEDVIKLYDLRFDLHTGGVLLHRDDISLSEAGFTDGCDFQYAYTGILK